MIKQINKQNLSQSTIFVLSAKACWVQAVTDIKVCAAGCEADIDGCGSEPACYWFEGCRQRTRMFLTICPTFLCCPGGGKTVRPVSFSQCNGLSVGLTR